VGGIFEWSSTTPRASSTSWLISQKLSNTRTSCNVCLVSRHHHNSTLLTSFRPDKNICRWDVTVAFLARKKPRLPITYLETLLEYSNTDDWSFLTLNGCPIELVVAIAHLSNLAAIYEKSVQTGSTMFNRFPLNAVIEGVINFTNDDAVRLGDMGDLDANTDARRSRFHCIEAWRHAILLYAYRVFTLKQDTPGLRRINHLSRVILDHVRCIPRTEIIQKQLLLPMFLAASEVGDERNRSFVRKYCRHWSIESQYLHFDSAASLLETLWVDWDLSKRSIEWWGTKIQNKEVDQTSDTAQIVQPLVEELFLG
jgi:hypothetical protein